MAEPSDVTPVPRPLNARQLRFCREYVYSGIVGEAYRRAYNTSGTPGSIAAMASELLADMRIRSEIERLQEIERRRLSLDAEDFLNEIASIAKFDPDDVFMGTDADADADEPGAEAKPKRRGVPVPRPWDEIPPHARKCIASIETRTKTSKRGVVTTTVRYKFHDKLRALDKIAKHLGLNSDGGLQKVHDYFAAVLAAYQQAAAADPARRNLQVASAEDPPGNGRGLEVGGDSEGAEV